MAELAKSARRRAHVLQHVSFEGPARIADWLTAENYDFTTTRFDKSQAPPDLDGIQLLIVMGGPMSVKDELEFPWLIEEKQFIRNAIERGVPVLGICLGAQLIANALGASVFPNAQKEIGWFPVEGVSDGHAETFAFPKALTVFHWHGETFDLPAGARHLARSVACENQAFQYGSSVIGLQFHLEMSPKSIRDIVSHCRHELVTAEYIQSEADILSAPSEISDNAYAVLSAVLSYLTR